LSTENQSTPTATKYHEGLVLIGFTRRIGRKELRQLTKRILTKEILTKQSANQWPRGAGFYPRLSKVTRLSMQLPMPWLREWSA